MCARSTSCERGQGLRRARPDGDGAAGAPQGRGQVPGEDLGPLAHDHRRLDHVQQLADVPGPVVALEERQRLRRPAGGENP